MIWGAEEIGKKIFGGPSPEKKNSDGLPPGKKYLERLSPGFFSKGLSEEIIFGEAIARKK